MLLHEARVLDDVGFEADVFPGRGGLGACALLLGGGCVLLSLDSFKPCDIRR